MTQNFIPGLQLSNILYEQWVAPAMKKKWPQVPYTAALIGDGSEVLGFDNLTSTDHDWGPRLYLFLQPDDFTLAPIISRHLETVLPETIEGFPVCFEDPDCQKDFQHSERGGSPLHGIEFFTLLTFFKRYLAVDIQALTSWNWLTIPEALLLSATKGQIFRDDLGLKLLQDQISYYPHDIWLYKMAAQWTRISQEEAFFGRCHEMNDHLGSHMILSRLIRDIMALCYMQEKTYIPYNKWFGKGFQQLNCSQELEPLLLKTVQASSFEEKEDYLSLCYQKIAQQHNALKLTDFLTPTTSFYYTRPYQVIRGERFASALKNQIQDSTLTHLSLDIGTVNQYLDSTDLLTRPNICQQLKHMYSIK